MSNKTLGQVAYEGYCNHTKWVSLASGQSLPQWDQVKPEIKAAWEAAAQTLVDHSINQVVSARARVTILGDTYTVTNPDGTTFTDKLPMSDRNKVIQELIDENELPPKPTQSPRYDTQTTSVSEFQANEEGNT